MPRRARLGLATPASARHPARRQPRCDLPRRRRPARLPSTPAHGVQRAPRGHPCLRTDGQPRPPAAYTWDRRLSRPCDAGQWTGLRQAFNARHQRSGALWQGRFNSCLVDSDRYLLTVCRYIELNSVRAAMVERPEDCRWSSVHTHLGTARDPLITPHPLYVALGPTIEARALAYRHWIEGGVSPEELADVRRYMSQQRALGDQRFQAMVEKTLNRPAVYRPGGRPKAKVD